MTGRGSGRRWAALLATAVLPLSGCTAVAATAVTSAAQSARVPAGLERFYQQALQWKPCPAQWAVQSGAAETAADAAKAVTGFQCAWLTVPLSYQDPGGPTIRLALNRLPAASPAQRIGPLFTNPGGPGGSGLGFAFGARDWFTPRLLARYDIVGMDPRGVGLSQPVNCRLTAKQQAEEDTNELGYAKDLATACQRSAANIIPYVGTDNAARDLDIARAALGAPKLDYYGASYGTLLGQTYAGLFPQNVGRMALDSVESPTGDLTEQAAGFESTFRFFAASCVQLESVCPMGATQATVIASFDALTKRLRSAPLKGASGPITGSGLIEIVSQLLYKAESWPVTWQVLGALIAGSRSATALDALAAAFGSDESSESFTAIDCLSEPQSQRTVADARRAGQLALAAAPRFGAFVEQQQLNCALWPVPSPPDAGQPINAAGAPAILLLNNVYDPATPLTWARQVHAALTRSVLVTNVAGGHGAYPLGACTQQAVDDYLISFTLPAPGTTCHDDDPLRAALTVPVTG